MPQTTLYGITACDTCRKARKALAAAGHEVIFVDVRKTPLENDLLRRFLDRFGASLVNRSSATWRSLSQEERAQDPLALLKAHPALMKRPVIESGGELHLGWKAEVQAGLGVQ